MMQNLANIQPVDENGEPIDLTPEQLEELQMHYMQQMNMENEHNQQMQMQNNGYQQLTPEQFAMLQQQQAYNQHMLQQQSIRSRKKKRATSAKRKASSMKKKRVRKQKVKGQNNMLTTKQLMALLQQNPELQQQIMHQYQMQGADEGQPEDYQQYNVDKIEEEDNEESPMKYQPGEHMNQEKHHERPTEESANTAEEMMQQQMRNAQNNDSDEGIYEEDENQQMLANLSPEELAYLQQKAAQEQQMMGYAPDEVPQYYSPHQGNHRNIYDAQNNIQRNIINQNESLNGMLRDYIADIKRKELKKAKRNRRRSYAAAMRASRSGTAHTAMYSRKDTELKSKIKRDVKQVKLAKKIYMLANEIEKNRLLEEKQRMAELRKAKKKKSLKANMKTSYQEQMALLRQSILNKRMDRKIAKFARTQAMKE